MTSYAPRWFAIGSVVVLAACAGPTPYEPTEGPTDQTGYASAQVGEDRFRVRFEGNEVTSRETVETYLLYRAAEVAQREGAEWFQIVSEETDRDVDVNTYYTPAGFYGYGSTLGVGVGGFPYYGAMPYGMGFGYGGVGPYAGAGVGVGAPAVRATDSYEAYVLIELHDQRPPAQNVFNTQQIMERLGPKIDRSSQQ